MALSPENEKLFNILANDPDDVKELISRAAKHKELEDHPAVREHRVLRNVENPLTEKLVKLQEKLDALETKQQYERERDLLRSAPYHFNDDKIAKLEERMRDPDAPVFRSYRQAAEYFRREDSPLGTGSVSFGQEFGIASTDSTNGQKWREDMLNSDPKLNPLKMDRRTRKLYVRKLAKEAAEDYKQTLGR